MPRRDRPAILPVGTTLKRRFVLGPPLAHGGMSTIYGAVDQIKLRTRPDLAEVALKLVRSIGGVAPEVSELIHREGLLLQGLAHPNIVRAFDTDREDGIDFMVMERLRGRTLADILRKDKNRRIVPNGALAIIRSAGEALQFIHGRGIVHGDVKPNNIFVTEDGEVKLIDFGVAQSLVAGENDLRLGNFLREVGAFTPAYTSLELLSGDPPAESDDVFSLAVVLYVMLTGEHPYGGKDALEAAELGLAPRRPGLVTGKQWAALRKALELEHGRRTPSLEDFLGDLFRPNLIQRLWV